ncbi:MAG TPA: acetyl-CoA carboxylase biotin carboxyl carrier protein [Hellea balneolensis]|uniref:Biotin carboxyl carrier protein of acetyl-CoA carboxylase n=1 Tax=Hellea balneolensis TaxID=287478 RepID=A0A7C3C1I4_9PROT|nr:acetyl-CoA carboxylase biotin carboxyl carrier protein [Hellea balneolensis]
MAQKPTKGSNPETKLLRELAKILNETDLSEIELEKGDLKLRVARNVGSSTAPVTVAHAAPVAAAPAAAAPETAPAAQDPAANKNAVKSPMVGTAYVRPSPESDPFITVGDSVKQGDTLLLIEAMKTFNPIKAEKSGTVTQILIEDGQPVEFGEALLIIG